MIFFESENFYCALPKGPVIDEHFLVVPKQHIPNQVQVINDDSLREEYLKIKNMVISNLSKKGQSFFAFERFIPFKFEKAQHLNLQIIAIPGNHQNIGDKIEKLSAMFLSSEAKNTNGQKK